MKRNKVSVAVGMFAVFAFAAVAPAATKSGEVVINGVTWQYKDRDDEKLTVTLGADGGDWTLESYKTAMPKGTVLDAASIPWVMEIEGKRYTVTEVWEFAFAGCSKLAGTLSIPDAVKKTGERSFYNTGITKIESLGGVQNFGTYTFYDSKSLAGNFPDLSNVTSFGTGPLMSCPKLTGEARVNDSLASITYRTFRGSSLDRMHISRSVTSVGRESFMGTKLAALVIPGPNDVLSGSQTYTTIDGRASFSGCKELSVLVFGKNTKGGNHTTGTMLDTVSGCTVFLPANGKWTGLVTGGTDNEVVAYGPDEDLDIIIDEAVENLTAVPKTQAMLEKVLSVAAVLKERCNLNMRIEIAEDFALAEGAITEAMLAGIRPCALHFTFAATTQARLDQVLAAVPASLELTVDPAGAKEPLAVPPGRNLWVLLPGDGKFTPYVTGSGVGFKRGKVSR